MPTWRRSGLAYPARWLRHAERLAVGVGALAVSCARPPAAEHGRGASARQPDDEAATTDETPELAAAHALAEEARALRAPAYEGTGDVANARAFIADRVAPWVAARRRLHDRAHAAYLEAIERGPTATTALAASAAMDLELEFAKEFIEAGLGAMPPAIQADGELASAYRRALVEGAMPQFQRARRMAQICVTAAEGAALPSVRARCASVVEQIAPEASATEGADAAAPGSAPPDAPPPGERSWVETTVTEPCTLAGSALVKGVFHGAATGGQRVAATEILALRFEVAALTPPTKPGGRAQIELGWPVRATWWLDAGATAVELARRVDLVPGHVWLAEGTEVTLLAADGVRATVARDLTEGGDRPVEPATFRSELPCRELRLVRTGDATPEPPGEWRAVTTGGTPLHDGAGGRAVARIAWAAWALESRAGFTHVVGTSPFGFDGWVRSTAVRGPGPFGMIGLLESTATHVARAELPLRLEPRRDAPTIGSIVVGAGVTLVSQEGEYTAVTVDRLEGGSASGHFYVEKLAFERGAARIAPSR